jgi:hypothetical protein
LSEYWINIRYPKTEDISGTRFTWIKRHATTPFPLTGQKSPTEFTDREMSLAS